MIKIGGNAVAFQMIYVHFCNIVAFNEVPNPMNLACTISLIIAAFLLSCAKQSENSPQLIEANRLHLEAMKIAEQAEQKLDSLAPLVQNRSEMDSLKKLVETWESHVIEVPGFAHAHDHSGHHTHEHKAAPSMTDESMLDYQRQSRQAILELKEAIDGLSADH